MQLSFPLTTTDANGKLIPITNKVQGDFVFKLAGTQTVLNFTGFENCGNGCYRFWNWAATAEVNLYINTTYQGWFGTQWVADAMNLSNLEDVNFSSIQNGHLIIYNSTSGKWENRLLLYTDMPAHVVFDNQNLLMMQGSQQQFAHPFRITPLPEEPEFDNSLAWAGWVNAKIASIPISVYQDNTDIVRFIPGGTIQAGKVYNDLKAASDYLNGFASSSRETLVWITSTKHDSGANLLASGGLHDYVHFTGTNKKKCKIIFGSDSISKIISFENMRIYFGISSNNGGFNHARTVSNMNFINCDIYSFHDLTFNNGELQDNKILNDSGHKSTLDGNIQAEGNYFNQKIIKAGTFTGEDLGNIDDFNESLDLGTDPTTWMPT